MDENISSRNIIVIGANGGIGLEIAKTFLNENANVILPYHSKRQNIDDLIKIYGEGRVNSYSLDLKNLESIDQFVEVVKQQFEAIDVLINNAGISRPAPLEELKSEKWNEVMDTNVRGPFFLSQKILPLMKKAGGGSIVNISSMSGHEAYPGMGAYSTSKAGLIMLTKQMAFEWADYNIRVNAISPGLIRTPLTEDMYQNEAIHQQRKSLISLKRIGTGEDIANIVSFLCSPKSAYITGQSILADGGLIGTIQKHIAGRPESK